MHAFGQQLTQAVGFADPGTHAGGRVGRDKRTQALGLQNRVFAAEHAAPGLPENRVVLADLQVVQQVVQFVEEQADSPEGRGFVGQVRGAAVAQLVVVDDGVTTGGDVLEGIDVIMGAAGTAVDDHQRCTARGQVAGDAIPGLIGAEGRKPFADFSMNSISYPALKKSIRDTIIGTRRLGN